MGALKRIFNKSLLPPTIAGTRDNTRIVAPCVCGEGFYRAQEMTQNRHVMSLDET